MPLSTGTPTLAAGDSLSEMTNARRWLQVRVTETLALLYAIKMSMGRDRVMFETDSMQLMRAVNSEVYDLAELGAIVCLFGVFFCWVMSNCQ